MNHVDDYPSKQLRNVWRYLALQNRIVATRIADTMSTSARKEYAHFKDCKFNKVATVNGIVLIQVACSSLPCTLSLYNAFMWTVSIKAGQKRTEERRTNERTNERTNDGTNDGTNERTNTSRGLLKFTNRFIVVVSKICPYTVYKTCRIEYNFRWKRNCRHT